jgi:hypothetical protein
MTQLFPTFPRLVKPPYWEYFLAIEDDLLQTSRYVEFAEANFHVHSIEFARLLLVSASEVDVIAKEFCKLLDPSKKAEDINDYQTIISTYYPKFSTFELYVPRFNLVSKPWQEWNEGKKIPWWQAYNGVKHERSKNYELATLGNVLSSVAGLFSLSLYYYREIPQSSMSLDPPPKLYSSKRFSGVDAHTQIWAYDLPDKYLHRETP